MAKIANPEGASTTKMRKLAVRPAQLAGSRIALVSNQKPGGTSLLHGAEAALRELPGVQTWFGTKPSASRAHPDLHSVRAKGDAAVVALGD